MHLDDYLKKIEQTPPEKLMQECNIGDNYSILLVDAYQQLIEFMLECEEFFPRFRLPNGESDIFIDSSQEEKLRFNINVGKVQFDQGNILITLKPHLDNNSCSNFNTSRSRSNAALDQESIRQLTTYNTLFYMNLGYNYNNPTSNLTDEKLKFTNIAAARLVAEVCNFAKKNQIPLCIPHTKHGKMTVNDVVYFNP